MPESAEDMSEKGKSRDPIPEEFGSIEAAAEFWDAHGLADYWDQTREVHFDVDLQRCVVLVPLEQGLADRLDGRASRRRRWSTCG
jgi:hypothetical protein